MIAWLRGKVQYVSSNFTILDVGGVGYEIFMTEASLAQLKYGEEFELFIHEVIREDAHTLYGFLSDRELFLFKDLISVSGVGPKIGLAILNQHAVDVVIQAVFSEQVAVFSSVSGIGPKSASRLVLELKGKFKNVPAMQITSEEGQVVMLDDTEVLEALTSLGYPQQKVSTILPQLSSESTEERVREALKLLNS